MKCIKIDENAHKLLCGVKEAMKEEGFEKPSFSDAIRWVCKKAGVGER